MCLKTTEQKQEVNMAKMRRWTAEKLAKELAFAEACKNDDAESLRWYEAVSGESARRAALPR